MNKILKIFLIILAGIAVSLLIYIPIKGTNFASIFIITNTVETGVQEGDLKYCFSGYTFENNKCVQVDDSYFNNFKEGDFIDIGNVKNFIGKKITTHGYVKSIITIDSKNYIVFCDDYPNQCLISEILKNDIESEYFYLNKNVKMEGIVMKINNEDFKNILFLYQTDPESIEVFNSEINSFETMSICDCEEWEEIYNPTTTRITESRVCHPSRCSNELRYK